MSGNEVLRGYSIHNKQQAQNAEAIAGSALTEALQAKTDAENADTKAQEGIDNAATAQTKAEEIDDKADDALDGVMLVVKQEIGIWKLYFKN